MLFLNWFFQAKQNIVFNPLVYAIGQSFPTFLCLGHPTKEKYNLRHPVADQ